jgi:DHA1 family multidrug resistance protein-like MFS transporter
MMTQSDPKPAGREDSWMRTLFLMVAVQFVMSLSLGSTSPILPLYLQDLGIDTPSAVDFWSGVLSSINFLVAALVSPFWGTVADRYGRKVMVLRSSAAICVFMALMGLSTALWQLVALRALMGAFSGFSAASIALVATRTPDRRLGFALGWLSTGQLVGGLVGPLVGGSLSDLSGSHRVTFFFTSLFAASAGLIALFGVRNEAPLLSGRGKPGIGKSFHILFATPGLLPVFFVLLMAQFGVRSVQPVVTPFVLELSGMVPGLATLAGLAFSITGVADVIASPFLGKRSDVIGYRKVLLICLAGAALMTLPQALVGQYWEFLAFRFGLGLFAGGILPTANALVGRMVDARQRGLVYGATASATFLGSFLGPFAGGSVASLFGIRWVFVLTGVLFLVNLVWVMRVVPPHQAPIDDTENEARDSVSQAA